MGSPSEGTRPLIRAVTFDAGGTLIHPMPSVGHIYASVAARHPEISPEELNVRFAAAWARLKNFSHTYAQWAALVDETFAGLTTSPPSRTFFPELYERFAEADAWAIFPDVVETLEQLSRTGRKLGVVSNWDERLKPLLRKLQLYNQFQAVIVSCDVGSCKPAPAVFHAAARALNTRAEEILHVGDSYEMDACGAIAAGMQAALVQRSRMQNSPLGSVPRQSSEESCPHVVGALTELVPLVHRL